MADIAKLTLILESKGIQQGQTDLKQLAQVAISVGGSLEAIRVNTDRTATAIEGFGRNASGAVRLFLREMSSLKQTVDSVTFAISGMAQPITQAANATKQATTSASAAIVKQELALERLAVAEVSAMQAASNRVSALGRERTNAAASISQQQALGEALNKVKDAYAAIAPAADAAAVATRAELDAVRRASGNSGPLTQQQALSDEAVIANARLIAIRRANVGVSSAKDEYKNIQSAINNSAALAKANDTAAAAITKVAASEQALYAKVQARIAQQSALGQSVKDSTAQYQAMVDAANRAAAAVRATQAANRTVSGPLTRAQTLVEERQVANARLAAVKSVAKAQDDLTKSGERAATSTRTLRSESNTLVSSLAKLAAAYLSLATVSRTLNAAFQEALSYEKYKLSFETLLGSQEKAVAMIERLRGLSSATGFDTDTLAKATGLYLSLGGAAATAEQDIRAVAAQAAAMGKGADQIDRVVLALGQIKAKGFLSGEEVRQLANNNVKVWEYLTKVLNVDVAQAMDMAQKKMINADAAIQVILNGLQDDFGGSLEKRLNTVNGAFDRVVNNVKQSYAQIGEALFEVFGATRVFNTISATITEVTHVVTDLVRSFGGLRPMFEGTSESVERLREVLKLAAVAFAAIVAVELATWAAKTVVSLGDVTSKLNAGRNAALLFVGAIMAADWGRKWASESETAQIALIKLAATAEKYKPGNGNLLAAFGRDMVPAVGNTTLPVNGQANAITSQARRLFGANALDFTAASDTGFGDTTRSDMLRSTLSILKNYQAANGGQAITGEAAKQYAEMRKAVVSKFFDSEDNLYKNFENMDKDVRVGIESLRRQMRNAEQEANVQTAISEVVNKGKAATSYEDPASLMTKAFDLALPGIEAYIRRLDLLGSSSVEGTRSIKSLKDEIDRTADAAKRADLVTQLGITQDKLNQLNAFSTVVENLRAASSSIGGGQFGDVLATFIQTNEAFAKTATAATGFNKDYLVEQIKARKISVEGFMDTLKRYGQTLSGVDSIRWTPTKAELESGAGGVDIEKLYEKYGRSVDSIKDKLANLRDENARLVAGQPLTSGENTLYKFKNELEDLDKKIKEINEAVATSGKPLTEETAKQFSELKARAEDLRTSIAPLQEEIARNDGLKSFQQNFEQAFSRSSSLVEKIDSEIVGLQDTNRRLQLGDAFVEGEGKLQRYRDALTRLYADMEKIDTATTQGANAYQALNDQADALTDSIGRLNQSLKENAVLRIRAQFDPRINGPLDKNVSGFMQGGFNRRTAEALNTARDTLESMGYTAAQVKAQMDELTKLASLQELKESFESIAETIGDSFGSAFEDIITGTKGVGEAISSMLSDINRQVIQQLVTRPIANMVTGAASAIGGSLISSLVGGAAGASMTNSQWIDSVRASQPSVSAAPIIPSANGNVFSMGNVIPFANGGLFDIVSRPTLFPMRGNRTGVMGEAGPEAVMPLERGANGRLGVRASGSGGVTYNITQNITTPDADSFRKNSQAVKRSFKSVG